MRLLRLPQPFDHFGFLYEVKFEGLLALAHCERPSLPNGPFSKLKPKIEVSRQKIETSLLRPKLSSRGAT